MEDMESPVENAQQIKLQWGHAEVGVEDSTPCDGSTMTNEASMGPRRCRRGRPKCRTPWIRQVESLQWGHADVGVEDGGMRSFIRRRLASFNGATPMSAWKTRRRWLKIARSLSLLQWGHADVGVEDMGGMTTSAIHHPLQWGHADVGVEDSRCFLPMASRKELQWGHADVGVEDRAGFGGHHTDLST